MIIVAIDPGPHTGIATRLADGNITTQMLHNQTAAVWEYLTEIKPQVIVVERFRSGARISTDGLETIEIQGGVQSIAWIIKARFYWQSPSVRQAFIPDARAMLGAGKAKIESHAVDALAHLLRWEHFYGNNFNVD